MHFTSCSDDTMFIFFGKCGDFSVRIYLREIPLAKETCGTTDTVLWICIEQLMLIGANLAFTSSSLVLNDCRALSRASK